MIIYKILKVFSINIKILLKLNEVKLPSKNKEKIPALKSHNDRTQESNMLEEILNKKSNEP
ncbi:hypothetical protein [Campylobacter armoricus]|uniref:hypothetical protein n=1 Tax=Campylobacter armoricus TaxID=2505970 RepID=UPI0011172CCA|nr:hypothetical protein [Campylobacter armoricus]